jgi:flagellar hook-basal body complex protein FliE
MNIIPISSYPVQSLSVPQTAKTQGTGSATPFRSMLEDALQNLNEANQVKHQDSLLLATGDVDDIAAVGINAEKAEVAMQLLVQMRNKLLDAYQEIMRINV